MTSLLGAGCLCFTTTFYQLPGARHTHFAHRITNKRGSTRLQRIAELARRRPEEGLTTLAHHIDVDWLEAAWRRTRKDGAVGVDGVTAEAYAEALNENLRRLLEQFKLGTYKAPPVRRVHIPKDGGGSRPIGITSFEDKVLQRAVAMVLEAIYEQEFTDSSYGFRPGRSAHDALEALRGGLMEMGGGYVYEVDIQDFFGSLDFGHLRRFLDRRVRDGVLRRMIDKWLKAGVMEGGAWSHPTSGVPQGGVVSPILANIYLHEVIDLWFEQEVRHRLRGRAFLVRYADDFVIAFEREEDAARVMNVLPKRLGRYGLTVHPEKTRLVPFRRPMEGRGAGNEPQSRRPETFDLLGFTHYWGRSRRGRWVVKKKTARRRLAQALKKIWAWCRRTRHLPIRQQHKALSQKVRGHYSYYGITGNARALGCFRHGVVRIWRRWLGQRSQRGTISWDRWNAMQEHFALPPVRIVHSVYRDAAKP